MDAQERLFGSERLRAYAAEAAHKSLRAWTDGLLVELGNWRGKSGVHDDVCLVAAELT